MTEATPLDRLTAYVVEAPTVPEPGSLDPDDPRLVPLLALANAHDARLHALLDALVRRRGCFWVFDLLIRPETLLRGKSNERWNEGGKVVADTDLAIAKNAGGDLYVWNAHRGDVRALLHDEGWRTMRTYRSVDDFVAQMMGKIVEGADIDQVNEADDAYRACFAFAISVAGTDGLDDEVRARMEELGLL